MPTALFAQEWDGAYVGGALNYSMGESVTTGSNFTYNQLGGAVINHSFDGAGIEAFAGWNETRGTWLFGVEATVSSGGLASELVFNRDMDIDQIEIYWSGSVIGRVGYVAGSNLYYGGGGVVAARIRNIGGDVNARVLNLADAYMRDDVRIGTTFVAGVEHQINDNWRLRTEYSLTDFVPYRQANQELPLGSEFYIVDTGPIQTISLGAVFQF